MRRRIRLTGRRQLSPSVVDVSLFVVDKLQDKKIVTLTITKPQAFRKFPDTACIKLRLIENQLSETLDFGLLAKMEKFVEISGVDFSAPSCQLRVISTEESERGLILGSTDAWTLRSDEDAAKQIGLLMFQSHDISPRSWKLEIREDDYPVVYINKNIPQSRSWVQTDTTFISCVLPTIIREVFEDILSNDLVPEQQWQKDWIGWADTLMPGREPPWNEDSSVKKTWISDLIDSFCLRHNMLDLLVSSLIREVES